MGEATTNFDISLDDQRLLAIRLEAAVDDVDDGFVVVQNFFEVLKARVPN